MKIALFDLDHTLLPFDSGMAWMRFLVDAGELPVQAQLHYLDCCQQHVAGGIDIIALHRACVAPLRGWTMARLEKCVDEFERQLAPRVPPAMRALVQHHHDAGHVCALVTATTGFIAAPCARLFGISQVLATVAVHSNGLPTGEIDGPPCYGEHKLARVVHWLSSLTPSGAGLAALEASWFYSDSASDLPLLNAVSNPVAVNPDARLRAHALAAGWPLMEPAAPPALAAHG